MIDIASILIGGGFVVLVWFLLTRVFLKIDKTVIIDDPTDDEEFQDLRGTPHCPECGSYDLVLIDNCDGVPWLKGKTQEIDYYQCTRCSRRFNDEDWEQAKKFMDSGDSE